MQEVDPNGGSVETGSHVLPSVEVQMTGRHWEENAMNPLSVKKTGTASSSPTNPGPRSAGSNVSPSVEKKI